MIGALLKGYGKGQQTFKNMIFKIAYDLLSLPFVINHEK